MTDTLHALNRKRYLRWILIQIGKVAIILFVLAYLFPIIWMILSSFKIQSDAYAMPPKWVFKPTLMNYREILLNRGLIKFLGNSLLIVSLSCVATLFIGTMAAFALGRFRFKGNRDIAFYIMSTRMAPPVMVIIPIFIMYRYALNLYNSYAGMVLVYTAMNLPLAVWLLRGFFLEIPHELDEAAEIDGCSKWTAFWKVIFPLSGPGLAATGILSFIFAWNEFFFALILTAKKTRTLPVTVTSFVSGMGIEWGELNAAGTIIMIPLLIFAFFMQKHLLRGLTLGAVKG